MGLDMYLLAKSNKKIGKDGATGACSGLFPLTIATEEDEQEIGYWRKNYRLADFLTNMLYDDENDNCVPKEMSESQIEDTITFAKSELKNKNYENGWYDDDLWNYTIKTFKKALEHLKNGVPILYEQWY